MKTLTKWAPPVAVSLLLHATLIVLAINTLTTNSPVKSQLQAITVELQGPAQTVASKSPAVKAVPPKIPKPVPEPVKKEPAIVEEPVKDVADTATETSKAVSADKQVSSSSVEAKQSGLNVQPLSKLTRLPAFLRKIEPVYPGAEKRAGSQASVLAEVTIDEKGNVLEVKIIKSAGTAFDNAVIDALKRSMFVPGYINNDAVAVRVLVPFRFNLK